MKFIKTVSCFVVTLNSIQYVVQEICCISSHVGSALVKCGETEKKLGQAERDLKAKSMSHFLHQLKNFLEGDMKTITVSQALQSCSCTYHLRDGNLH